MADGQVENFTAPQTSSALNTANQPPQGVLWLDQVMMARTCLSPPSTPPSSSHPAPGPQFLSPWDSKPLLPSAPPWKEESAWWPWLRFRSLRTPGTVSCWWLASAGFYILAQSSVTGLWPLTMLCVYIVPFFSGTVSALQEWSYWSSQPPSEVWKWQKVPTPSFLQRVKPRAYFEAVLQVCISARIAFWSLPEPASTSRGAGRSRAKGWPWHAAVSPGARAKLLNFSFTKW